MFTEKKKKNPVRTFIRMLIVIFIIMNVIAIFHSYKFTHFSDKAVQKTDANSLTNTQKAAILLTGIDNPRPINKQKPSQPYTTITLNSNKKIECWSIKTPQSKGTVILFHGYGGDKSQLIDKSDEFITMGYSTFLVDFMGSGGSEGNTTSIGFFEAQQVKTCFDHLKKNGEKNIHLFGTSMGAAAILKAMKDYSPDPKSIIIECPFGSMYQTVSARFRIMGAPAFPIAGLLVFWGGTLNGFWAFKHNPEDYAKSVYCPTLLMYGEKDNRVSRTEIDSIFCNLNGKKKLATYPLAGHENYLTRYHDAWVSDVNSFLNTL